MATETEWRRGALKLMTAAKRSHDREDTDEPLVVRLLDALIVAGYVTPLQPDATRDIMQKLSDLAIATEHLAIAEPDGSRPSALSIIQEAQAEIMRLRQGAPQSAARHASAPSGYKCSDCTMDSEACPQCYTAWWKKRHPNTMQFPVVPEINAEYETVGNGITGVTAASVKRVKQQDDGSLTVVIDGWPLHQEPPQPVAVPEGHVRVRIPVQDCGARLEIWTQIEHRDLSIHSRHDDEHRRTIATIIADVPLPSEPPEIKGRVKTP